MTNNFKSSNSKSSDSKEDDKKRKVFSSLAISCFYDNQIYINGETGTGKCTLPTFWDPTDAPMGYFCRVEM